MCALFTRQLISLTINFVKTEVKIRIGFTSFSSLPCSRRTGAKEDTAVSLNRCEIPGQCRSKRRNLSHTILFLFTKPHGMVHFFGYERTVFHSPSPIHFSLTIYVIKFDAKKRTGSPLFLSYSLLNNRAKRKTPKRNTFHAVLKSMWDLLGSTQGKATQSRSQSN